VCAVHERPEPDQPVRSQTVGANVRAARELAGLSVREFARSLGVTASFLSQFELGRSQASVSTLFAIATQLNLSIDELLGNRVTAAVTAPELSTDAGDDGEVFEDEFMSFRSGVHWRRLTRRGDAGIDFLLTEYEPGADSAAADQPQRHPGTDHGYVLEGTLTVIVAGRRRRVGKDQAISLRGEVPHRFINETQALVRAIWFVSR
jgi:transcriptional regulator with XRE-family HTH domain